jgi:glyoxylase-like metal-dependent hydrolase (beta-lactamase superfamily II)
VQPVLRRLIRGALILLLLAVAGAAAGLVWMHLVVQRQRGPLPLVNELLDLSRASDLPTKVWVIETAQQATPRSSVLDSGSDPKPEAPYVMTHPSFVLEWADGRLLLIDAGLTRTGAVDFGGPLEQLTGAGPIQPLKTTALALGEATDRVKGIVFTHLHIDHVDGLRDICARRADAVKVFMTAGQLDTWTLFTAEGKDLVEHAGCTDRVRIGGAKLMSLDGFPGVGVIAAAGHTPGSQIIAAAVRDATGDVKRYIFSGDVTNTIDGVRGDVSKPLLYRLVIVPEDDDRLGELRRYLRVMEQEQGMAIVVSHDQIHLHSLGIPAWSSN